MSQRVRRWKVGAPIIATAICALGLIAPTASASPSRGATYVGMGGGGVVELDTSADGASVTRFKITEVATSCGTITSTTTGNVPITGDEFSSGYPSGVGLRFKGSFAVPMAATGVLSLKSAFPSCTSADVAWTSTTSTPPPQPSNAFSASLKGMKLQVAVEAAGKVKVAKVSNLLKAATASGAPPKIVVALQLTKHGRKVLDEKGKLKLKARVTFTPDGGIARTISATLKFKHRSKR